MVLGYKNYSQNNMIDLLFDCRKGSRTCIPEKCMAHGHLSGMNASTQHFIIPAWNSCHNWVLLSCM